MLRDDAQALFEAHDPYLDGSLRNHCLRLEAFTLALAERHGVRVDEDLVFAGCMLHDVGLLVKDPAERDYIARGARYVRARSEGWGLTSVRARDLDEIMRYNHSLVRVPGVGMAAELVRRAVQVEHSRGRLLHGLDRESYRATTDRLPWLRFGSVLLDFARTTLLDDGVRTLLPIFFPNLARPSRAPA